MVVVIDLDGVIWLGQEPIPGGAGAVARLRASGERIVFLTNNSMPTRLQLRGKLARMGIDCADGDLINSPQVAASLLESGERVLVVGGEGIAEAVVHAGCEPVRAGKGLVPATAPPAGGKMAAVGAVVVGLDLRFDYRRLSEAGAAIRMGAHFIATNDDTTYPMPEGLAPGGGAIVAAIAAASGVQPVIAGKPYEPTVHFLDRQVGEIGLVIGDRPSTDGALAVRLGARFALVGTGVTGADAGDATGADVVGKDLAEVVDRVLA
jgi:4-nitrophenyl phosphatase